MVEIQSNDWRITLEFRDLLRANAELANEYTREKECLALVHSHSREAYQLAKDKIIRDILSERAA